MPMRKAVRDVVVREFWSRVDVSSDPEQCWEWRGTRDKDGYGAFNGTGRARLGLSGPAQKVAWVLTYGKPGLGICVCHKCDNPPCCNPSHLFLGTHLDNAQDRDRKKRGSWASGENHGQSKLDWGKVDEIRSRYVPRKVTMRTLADEYGVTPEVIRRIVSFEAWKPEHRPV